MAKWNGTVKKSELEMGVWVLEADDGVTYQLEGVDQKVLKHGIRAEVEGEVDGEAMGFAMVGPILRVKQLKPR